MVSQTLSQVSSSTSNQKVVRRKSSKPKEHKHETIHQTHRQHPQNRHSILSYQHENGSISSSSQGFMTKLPTSQQHQQQQQPKSRPNYNVNKQLMSARDKSSDSHQHQQRQRNSEPPEQQMNYATEASYYQPLYIAREDDAQYQQLVKNFHSHNRKEALIQSPNGNKLSQRSATNSQSSMGMPIITHKSHNNNETTNVVPAPKMPKKVISDLMQFTYKRNINNRMSEEPQRNGEEACRRSESHRIARNNTAL